MTALIDTSVLIGWENDRFDKEKMPESVSVSVVTVAELRLGVLTATTLEAKARRMATLRLAESLEPLPVDDRVADAWACWWRDCAPRVAGLRSTTAGSPRPRSRAACPSPPRTTTTRECPDSTSSASKETKCR